MKRSTWFLLAALVTAGCGGTSTETDSGTPVDVAAHDVQPGTDQGPAFDTGTDVQSIDDTGPTDDVGEADTGPMDSGPVDSGRIDSGRVDSGPVDSGPRDAATAVTFTSVYGIISSNCAPCHTSESDGSLSMATANAAYTNLVGVRAMGTCSSTGLDRVNAGHSAQSVLWRKVSGMMLCGNRMPRGRAPLSMVDINRIRDWIDQGALHN